MRRRLLGILILVISALQVWGASVPPPLGPTSGQWELTLNEDFLGPMNWSLWVPQITDTSGFVTGTTNYTACYINSTNNIAVANGFLNLTLRQEASNITCRT